MLPYSPKAFTGVSQAAFGQHSLSPCFPQAATGQHLPPLGVSQAATVPEKFYPFHA